MDISLNSFSFQGEEVRSLIRQARDGRMVHAILITGEEGVGKRTLARLIASALLCRGSEPRPCGGCADCLLAEKGDHPDLILIRQGIPLAPDGKKDRATIPVEDIREMIRLCGTTTMGGGNRVVLFPDADKMTPQAQNCLLKTLEEPPERTYFLLVTAHTDALLDTILSRCRSVPLHPWPEAEISRVLVGQGVVPERIQECVSLAEGSVGRALRMAGDDAWWEKRKQVIADFFELSRRGDILRVSGEWKDRKKGEADFLFDTVEEVIRSMIDVRLGRKDAEKAKCPAGWTRFAREAGLDRFVLLLDTVGEARRQAQANVNFQAAVEQLLLCLLGERTAWQM